MWLIGMMILMPQSGTWSWPIDTGPGLSAVFGQLQGSELNPGIEFICLGETGRPVRAARAGVVSWVSAGRDGKKTVSIRHEDGTVSSYAPLAGWDPLLAEKIRALGTDPDQAFEALALELNLNAGDTLGSAMTGQDGAPYLRFAVRNDRTWIDPLSLDLPPLEGGEATAVLAGLYLEPLDLKSQVNGQRVRQFVAVGQTIVARGQIGIGVFAGLVLPGGKRTAVRGIKLRAGEEEIASWQPKQLSHAAIKSAAGIYDRDLSGDATFIVCFDDRRPQTPVGDYQARTPWHPSDGASLTVSLLDLKGVWHDSVFQVQTEGETRAPTAVTPLPMRPSSLTIGMVGREFSFTSESAGTLQVPRLLTGQAPGVETLYTPTEADLPAEIRWRSGRTTQTYPIGLLPEADLFCLDFGPFRLRASGLKKPAIAMTLDEPDPKQAAGTLAFRSSVLRFGRNGLSSPGLTVSYEEQLPAHCCLFQWSTRDRTWRFVSVIAQGETVALERLAPVVVAEDLMPPSLLMPRVHHYPSGPRIVIPVHDQESGIDPGSLRVAQGDRELETFFDPDFSWVVLPADAEGPFALTAADRAGQLVSQAGLTLARGPNGPSDRP